MMEKNKIFSGTPLVMIELKTKLLVGKLKQRNFEKPKTTNKADTGKKRESLKIWRMDLRVLVID